MVYLELDTSHAVTNDDTTKTDSVCGQHNYILRGTFDNTKDNCIDTETIQAIDGSQDK